MSCTTMADMDLASSVALVKRHMYVQGLAHKLTFKIVGKLGHHRALESVSELMVDGILYTSEACRIWCLHWSFRESRTTTEACHVGDDTGPLPRGKIS